MGMGQIGKHGIETDSTRERNLYSLYWHIRPFIDSVSLVVVGKKILEVK